MNEEIDDLLKRADNLRWITERGTDKWKMEFKNRVKDLIHKKGSELRPHPKNPRQHPVTQVNAMRGVLEEMGIAGALLVYIAADGVLTIIDGECRGANFQETTWPCLLIDVTDEEAEYLLATHDPLAALAEVNSEKLEELLQGLTVDNAEVRALLEKVARESGVVLNDGAPDVQFKEFDESAASQVKYHECPNCGHKWPQ